MNKTWRNVLAFTMTTALLGACSNQSNDSDTWYKGEGMDEMEVMYVGTGFDPVNNAHLAKSKVEEFHQTVGNFNTVAQVDQYLVSGAFIGTNNLLSLLGVVPNTVNASHIGVRIYNIDDDGHQNYALVALGNDGEEITSFVVNGLSDCSSNCGPLGSYVSTSGTGGSSNISVNTGASFGSESAAKSAITSFESAVANCNSVSEVQNYLIQSSFIGTNTLLNLLGLNSSQINTDHLGVRIYNCDYNGKQSFALVGVNANGYEDVSLVYDHLISCPNLCGSLVE